VWPERRSREIKICLLPLFLLVHQLVGEADGHVVEARPRVQLEGESLLIQAGNAHHAVAAVDDAVAALAAGVHEADCVRACGGARLKF